MTVGKGVYSGTASKEVDIRISKTEAQSGTLTAADFFTEAPADAKITVISNKSTANNILSGTPSINFSGSLSYSSNTNLTVKDVSDTYEVTIVSKNYEDIKSTLSFKTMEKTPITMNGLTAPTNRKYNGIAMKDSDFGTPSYSPAWSGTLNYTYYEGKGTSGTILESAPKNAGTYTVVAKIPDSDTTYAGSKEITFTIAKADITIKANDKSAYVGDTAPELKASDYTITGLTSGETLKTEPTIAYAAAPDMTKEGTVDIKASGAAVPNIENYNDKITYEVGKLTINSKSSGGGYEIAKPSEPVTGTSNATAEVDNQGNATVNISDQNIANAVKAAKDAANKNGKSAGEITAIINVSAGSKEVNKVTVNLPKNMQEQIIKNNITNFAVLIDKPDISIGMDLTAIKEMNKQAGEDIQLSAVRTDASVLSKEAKTAIGSRPVFEIKATYANGTFFHQSFLGIWHWLQDTNRFYGYQKALGKDRH